MIGRPDLRHFRISLLCLWIAAVASAPLRADNEPRGIRVDGIAAVVGSQVILLSEVYVQARPMLKEAETQAGNLSAAQRKELLKTALDEMIDDRLVAEQAAEMQVQVTTEEVETAILSMARENGLDMPTFERALESQGTTMMEYRASMRRELLKYKVINLRVRGRVKLGEAEAREYYNTLVRDVRASGSFVGAHILIRVPADARNADIARLRKEAVALKEKLISGASFAELARAHSQDTVTAPRGGTLGRRMPGDLPRTLDAAFQDLEEGEISGPVRTSAGFHIIKVLERENLGVQPFAEVKNRILGQLMQDEMMRQQKIWLGELRARTFIDIRL
jgi:peptidyl-prolyl cis-trans isomerase SurA